MGLLEQIAHHEEEELLTPDQRIVNELVNTDNLDTKTDLKDPLKWASLDVKVEFLEKKTCAKCVKVLQDFRKSAFSLMISHERKGRQEYLQALQQTKDTIHEEKKDPPISMK